MDTLTATLTAPARFSNRHRAQVAPAGAEVEVRVADLERYAEWLPARLAGTRTYRATVRRSALTAA